MKGSQICYSNAELAWIKAHAQDDRRIAHREFCALFGRTDVSQSNFSALCKRKGWLTGRSGRFVPGQTPINKGVKCSPGQGGNHPNARRTQFQAGQLPHNTKYLGHERISKDGYVEISIDEENPHTGYERRYVLKHKYLWEQKHGPVPDGMCLKCQNGNRQDTDPDNWKLISREMLPHLGGRFGFAFDHADPDVKPAMLAIAELKHRAKKLKKQAAQQ